MNSTCESTKQAVIRCGMRLKRFVTISSVNTQQQAAAPAMLMSNEKASSSCR